MSAKKWGAELIGFLICRKMDPPNVWERFWELTPKNPKPDDKSHPTGFWTWLIGIVGGIIGGLVGFGLGLAGMLEGLATAVGGAAGFLSAMTGVLRMMDKAIKALEANPEKAGGKGTLKGVRTSRPRWKRLSPTARLSFSRSAKPSEHR